jgi:predicted amidohydrolase YtcJ
VVAVGDDANVREHAGAATELIDGRGIALVPRLVDSHIHPFHGTRGADLSGLSALDEVRGALAAERGPLRAGEWLLGRRLSYDAFGGERIGADAIAGVTGDAPAYLTFFDYHSALASRPALALVGVIGARRSHAALRRARAARPGHDRRGEAGRAGSAPHRIEQIETLGDAELPRFAAEGVAASMQPLHAAHLDEPGRLPPIRSSARPTSCPTSPCGWPSSTARSSSGAAPLLLSGVFDERRRQLASSRP